MKEILKEIKEYKNYYISNLGNVYSAKSGKLIKLNPYIDSKGNYLMIRLIRNDGIRKSLLIHRLVAEHFIPNPLKLPEVNHKDKNTKNPKVDNLEWCTRKENLYDSYSTMSPIRNKMQCELYKNSIYVGEFESIKSAAKYAKENFNVSESSMNRYLKSGNVIIVIKNKP